MELLNVLLAAILLLLVRKLIWCFRWLWCYHHGRQTHRTGGRAESRGYLHLPEAVICFSGHISAIARIRKLMIEGHVRDFCESSL